MGRIFFAAGVSKMPTRVLRQASLLSVREEANMGALASKLAKFASSTPTTVVDLQKHWVIAPPAS